jgi:hypothetical protein
VISRLIRYVRGSFPPAFYLPYAAAWALGVSALCALADPRIGRWRPGVSILISLLTMVVALLILRAIDDVKDLDYDLVHNPERPLPGGAVTVADLGALVAAGALIAVAANAAAGRAAELLITGTLAYALLLLIAERALHWPPGNAVLLSALVSFPVQLLLNLYLYALVLHAARQGPSWHVLPALLVAVTAFMHLEYGRKITRRPRPGERSYVTVHGANGTAAVAVVCAAASTLLGLALTRPWAADGEPWGWITLATLAFPVYGADRFWRRRKARWPLAAAACFVLSSFAAYLVIGLTTGP